MQVSAKGYNQNNLQYLKYIALATSESVVIAAIQYCSPEAYLYEGLIAPADCSRRITPGNYLTFRCHLVPCFHK
jgi:hypothetical protein